VETILFAGDKAATSGGIKGRPEEAQSEVKNPGDGLWTPVAPGDGWKGVKVDESNLQKVSLDNADQKLYSLKVFDSCFKDQDKAQWYILVLNLDGGTIEVLQNDKDSIMKGRWKPGFGHMWKVESGGDAESFIRVVFKPDTKAKKKFAKIYLQAMDVDAGTSDCMDTKMCFLGVGTQLQEHMQEANLLKNSVSRLLDCANGKSVVPPHGQVCFDWEKCMTGKQDGTMETFKGFAKALIGINRRAAKTVGTGLLSINQSFGAPNGTTTAKPKWCSSAEEDEGSADLMEWCQCKVAIGEHIEKQVPEVPLDEYDGLTCLLADEKASGFRQTRHQLLHNLLSLVQSSHDLRGIDVAGCTSNSLFKWGKTSPCRG